MVSTFIWRFASLRLRIWLSGSKHRRCSHGYEGTQHDDHDHVVRFRRHRRLDTGRPVADRFVHLGAGRARRFWRRRRRQFQLTPFRWRPRVPRKPVAFAAQKAVGVTVVLFIDIFQYSAIISL